MRHKWLIALLIALLPALALADHRDRGGRRHDRGDRYDGHGLRSYIDVSVGYGARYGGYSYGRFSYGSPTYRGTRYYAQLLRRRR